jgi:hypothetical protein
LTNEIASGLPSVTNSDGFEARIMLQVISGKFFEDNGRPVNDRDEDAVLYSNYSWNKPIVTAAAELRPVDHASTPIATYVIRYKSRYQPSETDIIYLPTCRSAGLKHSFMRIATMSKQCVEQMHDTIGDSI